MRVSTVISRIFYRPLLEGDGDGARHKVSSSESRPSFVVLFLIALFPLLILHLVPVPLLTRFQWIVYDASMRMRNSLSPHLIDPSIRLVGVSDADEQRLDQDLANRQSYMELLALLREQNAQAVAFDIFFIDQKDTDDLLAMSLAGDSPPVVLAYSFTQSDPPFEPKGSPPQELAEYAEAAESSTDQMALVGILRDLDDYLYDLREYEHSLRRGNASTREEQQVARESIAWVREIRDRVQRRWFWLSQGHEDAWPEAGDPYIARNLRLLSPRLITAPSSLGFANVEKEGLDVVRFAPLVYAWRGRLFPHLSLAMALEYYGVSFSDVEVEWGKEIRFTPLKNGTEPVHIPIDEKGNYLVNFREGESFLNRSSTLCGVVLPEVRDEETLGQFNEALVFVGEAISGGSATDLEPIPLQTEFPMVGLHVNILDNIIKQDFLRKVSEPLWLLVLMLLGLMLAWFYYQLPFAKASVLTVVVLLVLFCSGFFLFLEKNLVMPIVQPLAGVVLSGFGFFGYLIVVKERDRRVVRDVFLKTVSPRIGQEILKKYDDEAIWGARREITVLFIDVRGYTSMSESHPPEVVLELLDQFYDTASEKVFLHEGQVNKFLGDAVLALFGALPEEPDNHAERALRAAADIQRAMVAWNQSDRVRELGVNVETGAGVNTGVATVGLVGRRRIRIEYTALGDPVNIASRIQGAAGAGEIVAGDRSVELAGGAEAEVFCEGGLVVCGREELTVKGKREAIAVYRLKVESTVGDNSNRD